MLYELDPRDLIDNKCGTGYWATEKEGHLQPPNAYNLIDQYQQDVGLADIHADGGPR